MLYDNKERIFLKTHFENVSRMLLRHQITLCYLKNILKMLYDNKERIFFKTHFENVCREHSSRTFWELPTENITRTFRHNVIAISSFNIL